MGSSDFFIDRFAAKYSLLKAKGLDEFHFDGCSMKRVLSYANAIAELAPSKDSQDIKFGDFIISYMDVLIKQCDKDGGMNHDTWLRVCNSANTTYLEPVGVFLTTEHGYVTRSYVFEIVLGVFVDVILFIFLNFYFPFVTCIALLIKYSVLKYKKSKGKVLDFHS